jgi:hypothetical protein
VIKKYVPPYNNVRNAACSAGLSVSAIIMTFVTRCDRNQSTQYASNTNAVVNLLFTESAISYTSYIITD